MPDLLAFDTSTEFFSIAVQHGDAVLSHRGAGGAQASSTLLPLIQKLLAEAGLSLSALDAIVFGEGPGSFTGLRTACAVAQGLAFGAERPVLPVGTLLAVAEEAHHRDGARRVTAVLDARMGEIYAASYSFDGSPADGTPRLMAPEQLQVPEGFVLAGNAFAALGERLPGGIARHEVQPLATAMLRLAPGLLAAGHAVDASQATPLYVRDKVAQTTAEREAARSHPNTP